MFWPSAQEDRSSFRRKATDPRTAVVDEKTKRLWEEFERTRSIASRNRLVEAYIPLVKNIAEFIRNRLPSSVLHDDLVSDGTIGLTEAIERFSPSRGVKFGSYSRLRIQGAIVDGLRRMDWMPRAERLRGRAKEMRSLNTRVRRLDQDDEDAPQELWQVLPSLTASNPLKVLTEGELFREFNRFLDPRERVIVRLYYRDGLKMLEVGKRLGICEARVSQLLQRIMKRLQEPDAREVGLAWFGAA